MLTQLVLHENISLNTYLVSVTKEAERVSVYARLNFVKFQTSPIK